MVKSFKNLFVPAWGMFSLPRRQAWTIYGGLLWVIPLAMITPFRSLYLVSVGFSSTEVGFYSFVFIPCGIVCLWISGYLADIRGRKNTLFFFDILSWGGYCTLMTLAFNKWWAVAALFFFATNLASKPPYQCLVIEGVPKKKRAWIYSVLQVTNLTPALFFFPLMGGVWVAKRGLNTACHEMFGLFTIMILTGIFLRFHFIPHSGAYEKPSENWKHAVETAKNQYLKIIRIFFNKRNTRMFLFSKLIDEWMLATWAIYSSLYFVQLLGLKDTYLSLLDQVSAYIVCAAFFILVPRISHRWMARLLGLDQIFGFLALSFLLFFHQGENGIFWVCIISAILTAMGSAFYNSISAAVWMNLIGERERIKVMVISTTTFQMGVWVLGSVSAVLYGKISPVALLVVMIVMRVFNFFLLRRVSRNIQLAGPI